MKRVAPAKPLTLFSRIGKSSDMGINPAHFREFVVRPVLKHLDPEIPYSEVAEELIMLTVAHESDMGTYLRQHPKGPARSVYQIEKATFEWLVSYLEQPSQAKLGSKIHRMSASAAVTGIEPEFEELVWNLALATAFARLRYWVAPDPLPVDKADVNGLARYWGRFYQATSNPVKIAEAIRDYKKFVLLKKGKQK